MKYALIDTQTGRCIGISFLNDLVIRDDLILVDGLDVQIGDVYQNGQWTRLDPETPEEPVSYLEQRVEQLETDNAALMMELAGTNIKLTQTEQALADLMLMIATGGV
ncbi:hypothetical protein [Paenibacillus spongiae]|uniref:Uncharacterized protein n=1 Tax=Paenibacillus spongiae TaxID=2909671 RepID=A0ABY5SBS5_9BACL|nr:hypothetical protein [Paenibacillus spongiae]UVI31219.1 hypothetical protein L1F29_05075 [Paenibacillus spongiae]